MKALREWDRKDLTKKVYDFIARANIEMGRNTDGQTMAVWANSLAKHLQEEVIFKHLYLSDVDIAFNKGVIMGEFPEKQFLNIPTFWKWLKVHKKRIDDAIYNVETCGADETKELYYRKQKLLK